MYELKTLSQTVKCKKISNEEANQILNNINCLGQHMHTYFFYQIVKRNLKEMLAFIENCQKTLAISDTLECNRFLYNFIDSFYAYINFFESNYKETFQEIKKGFFDNRFEYAFIYKLRNYMIHEDLPIFKQEREVGIGYLNKKFIISKNKLLSSKRMTSNIKSRISIKFIDKDDIDIMPILKEFSKILIDIQKETLDKLFQTLTDSFCFLMKYIKKEEETYLYKDGEIINGLLNVTTKYYKSMAEDFVYDERLLQDSTINNIFMKFSYLYYGKENVIYKPKIKFL